MKIRLLSAALITLLLSVLAPLPLQAQTTDTQDIQLNDLPEWLLEFSNLSKEDKADYIEHFQEAKTYFTRGEWVQCLMHLDSCEMIFKGNPNIWNLRVGVLIEQHRPDEAEAELAKAKKALPDDAVTLMNIANLHMVKKEYQECITDMSAILNVIPYSNAELRDALTFRVYLCHLMLEETEAAQKLISYSSPMDDTPLYYFCEAATNITKKDRKAAMNSINVAQRIFSKTAATVPYQRALNASGLVEKYLSEGE